MTDAEIKKLADKLFPMEYWHIEAVEKAMAFKWYYVFMPSWWRNW